MKQYYIITDRHTLVLYLAWEVGVSRANQLLKKAERVTPWGYRVPFLHNTTRLKRDTVAVRQRIAQAAAYQEGRMGKRHFHQSLFASVHETAINNATKENSA